ncbi:hypothetical protein DL95DRAFT_387383 [Leptodontidium sp. 2 PMI_412]|nr:hypothetical protein DL95DRAFT_387383 [Leptodontidium sp. 2 PMI_412]
MRKMVFLLIAPASSSNYLIHKTYLSRLQPLFNSSLDPPHTSLNAHPLYENSKSKMESATPPKSKNSSSQTQQNTSIPVSTPAATPTPTFATTRTSSPTTLTISMSTSKTSPSPIPPTTPSPTPVRSKPIDTCPRCGAKEFLAACIPCGYNSGLGL